MSVENVSREEWIVGGLAVFLVIDLLFLPWFDISIGPLDFTESGTGSPDGGLGVIAMLAAAAYVADVAIEKFTSTALPAIGASRATTRLVLAGVAAGFVALKFVLHLGHTGDTAIGCWLAILSAAALVFLTMRPETLRT